MHLPSPPSPLPRPPSPLPSPPSPLPVPCPLPPLPPLTPALFHTPPPHLTVSHRNDYIAFKALLAPGPGTKSLSVDGDVKSKGLSSGSYTFYQETVQCGAPATSCTVDGMNVEKVTSPTATPTFQGCLDVCDKDGECAAVSMIGVPLLWTSTTSLLTACWKIKGDSTAGTFKRSLTKTNVTAMAKGVQPSPLRQPLQPQPAWEHG